MIILKQELYLLKKQRRRRAAPKIIEKTTYMERLGGRSEKLNVNLADV